MPLFLMRDKLAKGAILPACISVNVTNGIRFGPLPHDSLTDTTKRVEYHRHPTPPGSIKPETVKLVDAESPMVKRNGIERESYWT